MKKFFTALVALCITVAASSFTLPDKVITKPVALEKKATFDDPVIGYFVDPIYGGVILYGHVVHGNMGIITAIVYGSNSTPVYQFYGATYDPATWMFNATISYTEGTSYTYTNHGFYDAT